MRYRATLQRMVGAARFDTGYWYEINLPGLERSPQSMEACLGVNGPGDILLIAAMLDSSLYPNDGFRFVYCPMVEGKSDELPKNER